MDVQADKVFHITSKGFAVAMIFIIICGVVLYFGHKGQD